MTFGIVVVAVVAVVAVLMLIGVIWFLRDSNKRIKDFANSSDLIPGRPGRPGRAPAEWANATSTEALLHQRTRYAIADVHRGAFAPAVPPPPDSAIDGPESDLAALDDAVFALDDRIIAAAQLSGEERTAALGELEPKVAALEGLTGKLWDAPSAQRRPLIDAVTATLLR